MFLIINCEQKFEFFFFFFFFGGGGVLKGKFLIYIIYEYMNIDMFTIYIYKKSIDYRNEFACFLI